MPYVPLLLNLAFLPPSAGTTIYGPVSSDEGVSLGESIAEDNSVPVSSTSETRIVATVSVVVKFPLEGASGVLTEAQMSVPAVSHAKQARFPPKLHEELQTTRIAAQLTFEHQTTRIHSHYTETLFFDPSDTGMEVDTLPITQILPFHKSLS